MKMYEVGVKCGHVGRDHYVEKVVAIRAESGKDAASFARQMPRVKHHHPDAILYVNEITEDRYYEIGERNRIDPYFQCRCIQDQRRDCNLELKEESKKVVDEHTKWHDNPPVYHGKIRVRNPKKYFTKMVNIERTPYEAA